MGCWRQSNASNPWIPQMETLLTPRQQACARCTRQLETKHMHRPTCLFFSYGFCSVAMTCDPGRYISKSRRLAAVVPRWAVLVSDCLDWNIIEKDISMCI